MEISHSLPAELCYGIKQVQQLRMLGLGWVGLDGMGWDDRGGRKLQEQEQQQKGPQLMVINLMNKRTSWRSWMMGRLV